MSKDQKFSVETLEDRTVPTTFGIPWADSSNLTLSFAQDGSKIGTTTSNLYSSLNANQSTQDWQLDILRAFQVWAAKTNINIGLVSDSGRAFTAIGLTQGDPRFGDIRIGSFNRSTDVLASSIPFQPAAGSFSGDVFLNGNYNYGAAGSPDLFSVMVNEAGNAFGLPDQTSDLTSSMYTDYVYRTGINNADIAAIQKLYGARLPDDNEGTRGNNSTSTATKLSQPLLGWDPSKAMVEHGDITTLGDSDYYSFRSPLLNTAYDTFTVRLNAKGESLLTGTLTVLDANGRVIAQSSAKSPLDNNVQVSLPASLLSSTYYIKVQSAQQNEFGIGSYDVAVNFHNHAQPGLLGVVLGTVPQLTDNLLGTATDLQLVDAIFSNLGLVNKQAGTNDTFANATALDTPPGYDVGEHYEAIESISSSTEADMFQFRSAKLTQPVMQANIIALGSDAIDLNITVYDANQRVVPAKILKNSDGGYSIKLEGAVADSTYYLKVQGKGTKTSTGNYGVVIDYGSGMSQLAVATTSSLNANTVERFDSMAINKSQLYKFAINADAGAAGDSQAVQMTIFNSNGEAVFTMSAIGGKNSTGYVWLDQGDYVVRYTLLGKTAGQALLEMNYTMRWAALSDDTGPRKVDSTVSASDSSGGDVNYGGAGGSSGGSTGGSTTKPRTSSYSNPWYEQEYWS